MPYAHRKFFGTLAAAAFAGTLALAMPAMADDVAPAAHTHHHAKPGQDPVEAQISRLRNQLHITDAQNDAFNAVAQVMRDNRSAHEALVQQKRQNVATQSAVDDLNNYADIAQAHADGVKKLAASFATLYGSLSDDQKKAADDVFREHKRRMMHHALMHEKMMPKAQ